MYWSVQVVHIHITFAVFNSPPSPHMVCLACSAPLGRGLFSQHAESWDEITQLQICIRGYEASDPASNFLVHQITWHRFVNTRGGLGNNIPCDLYNEHVNKLVKVIIQNMGPNLTEQSLKRAVRCVSPLHAICKHFDAATHVSVTTSAHTTKSDLLDIEKVVKAVQ